MIKEKEFKTTAPKFIEKLVNSLDGIILDLDKDGNELSVGLSDRSFIDLFIKQLDNFAKPISNEIQGIMLSFDSKIKHNALIINTNSLDEEEIETSLVIADVPEYIRGSVFAYFNSLNDEAVAKYSGGATMAIYNEPITNATQVAITPGGSPSVASSYRKNFSSFTSLSTRKDFFSPINGVISTYKNGKLNSSPLGHINKKAEPLLVPSPTFNSWMIYKDVRSAKVEIEAILKSKLQKSTWESYAPGGNVYQQFKAKYEFNSEKYKKDY